MFNNDFKVCLDRIAKALDRIADALEPQNITQVVKEQCGCDEIERLGIQKLARCRIHPLEFLK